MVKKIGSCLLVAAFWLALWELASRYVAQEILLVSPVQAFLRLFELARSPEFWLTIGCSCARVLFAVLAAVAAGTLLAVAAAGFRPVYRLLRPLMGAIRATPVASFIILALVWVATDFIPGLIAFLMVTPIIWGNLTEGITTVDRQLLEMAAVFRFSRGKILRYIYIPAVLPHFMSACTAGLGFGWKSAVAAEVIARPAVAIGRQIYNAKIYLDTVDLFAWTIAVILLSLLIERVALRMLRWVTVRLSGPGSVEEGSGEDAAEH